MPPPALTRHILPPAPFVGRAAELAELTALAERARTGQGHTVLLTGELGVGKTRLAGQIVELARARGFAVAQGRAFAVESGLPYAIFADAMIPLLRGLEPAALTVLTRGAGGDLAGILPTLFTATAATAGESASDSRTRMFWSFTELLGRLSARQPLVLLLDNLQWADTSSLELLHFVARHAQSPTNRMALLIVGTYVDAEREDNLSLRAMERSLLALDATRITLPALSADQTLELVQRRFCVPAATVRQFASALHDWTRGNPFFIDETLTSLVESGQLVQRDGAWSGWSAGSLAPARSVRDVVLARADRLSAPARRLLDVVAVLGVRVTVESLRATSNQDDDALADALDELQRASFLVEESGTPPAYDFAHPLVRDTVYAALGPVRAQAMHDRVGDALEAAYGTDAPRHAAELAHHFRSGHEGASSRRAARYLAEAGRQALARHADRAAVEYLEAATSHEATGASRDVLELLAQARQRVGDVDVAMALWRRLRKQALGAGDVARVASADRRMGLMASAAGDHLAALAHFDSGLRVLEPATGETKLETRILLARATALQALGRRDEALADAARALAIASTLGDPALQARVHRAILLLHVWTGPTATAREHGERAVALAAASSERTVEWSAHWAMAIHGGLTGDAAATAHHVREARRLADEIRSPILRLWTADVAIEYLAGIGEWPEALALADEAIPAARALGQYTVLPRLLVWTGLIHRGLGDLATARALIEEAWALTGSGVEGGQGARDVHALVPAYTGMAGILMTSGDNAGALAVGEAGLAIADRTGYVAWAIYRLLPFIIESALYLEDYERAARHNARLRRDSEALGHALGLAWADTTDALLAYLTGDPAAAVSPLRSALAALERVPFVFDAARLRRLIARALVDAGDVAAAVVELQKAHEIFARLGAEGELRTTRGQLKQIGAKPRATRGAQPHDAVLSARELEIARLVAQRRSNKAIAASLAISARTVSTHLSNIFQKVGVTSRGELTDLVRSGSLDAPPE